MFGLQIIRVRMETVFSTIVKVQRYMEPFDWEVPTTKIHMVAADARTAVTFSLSPGQAHDAPQGRRCSTAWAPKTRNGSW